MPDEEQIRKSAQEKAAETWRQYAPMCLYDAYHLVELSETEEAVINLRGGYALDAKEARMLSDALDYTNKDYREQLKRLR